MLTEAQANVLAMQSDRHKIGVPVDRELVPPDLLEGLNVCLADNLLTWIDRCHHPAAHGLEIDVYLLTPAGRAALAEGERHGV